MNDLCAPSKPSAVVIADSISPGGVRVATLELRHHRFVLAESNTHSHSKSSASSRAIPVRTQLQRLLSDIAMPVEFGRNQPGMQALDVLDGDLAVQAETAWRRGAINAVQCALELFTSPEFVWDRLCDAGERSLVGVADMALGPRTFAVDPDRWAAGRERLVSFVGDTLAAAEQAHGVELLRVHKQIAARPLEPYMWHTAVHTAHVTGPGSSWANLLAQRATPASGVKPLAQPEFVHLADRIREALDGSDATPVADGAWHLPYLRDGDADLPVPVRVAVSVARVARTSYVTQNGVREVAKDLDLFARLATADPPHWTPFEHVLMAGGTGGGRVPGWTALRHLPVTMVDAMVEMVAARACGGV